MLQKRNMHKRKQRMQMVTNPGVQRMLKRSENGVHSFDEASKTKKQNPKTKEQKSPSTPFFPLNDHINKVEY